jgi:ribosome maturation factor RimP
MNDRPAIKRSPQLQSDLGVAFERELDALAHDAAFAELGVIRHRVRRVHGSAELSVTIDRQGGVDLSLCERVAARINAQLAGFDVPYTLEVESAGLDRPLFAPADYGRFAGERARVVTTLAIKGSKTHRGVRGEMVVLETERGELLLPATAIKSANLEYDARADLQRDKRERKKSHGNSRHRS